jgi:hypothetical protein
MTIYFIIFIFLLLLFCFTFRYEFFNPVDPDNFTPNNANLENTTPNINANNNTINANNNTINAAPAERVSAGGLVAFGNQSAMPIARGSPPMWSFWHNLDESQIPTIVKTNFECIKNLYPNWKLIVLTNDNINDYIPKDVIELGENLYITHKTDLYRLYVLKEYGGLWIDSSVLIKDTSFINSLYNTCLEQGKIAMFDTVFDNNTSGYPCLESWFIMSPIPHHYITEMWYNEFVKAIKLGFKKYRKLISSQVNVKHIYKYREYLTIHACLQYLIQKNSKPINDIIVFKSEETMYFIQEQCSWDADKYRETFLKYASSLPCIKLRGGEREIMADYDTSIYYFI